MEKLMSVSRYNKTQTKDIKKICDFLELNINKCLRKSESKVWHGTPVWFIDGNPIVSYSVRRGSKVSLMFFSGQSFKEMDLKPEGKFKASEIFYKDVEEIKVAHLKRWLKKAETIQWDYKNIVKRKGVLKKIIPQKKTKTTKDFTIKYHANGKTLWSKGKIVNGKSEGYWEWYRAIYTIPFPITF